MLYRWRAIARSSNVTNLSLARCHYESTILLTSLSRWKYFSGRHRKNHNTPTLFYVWHRWMSFVHECKEMHNLAVSIATQVYYKQLQSRCFRSLSTVTSLNKKYHANKEGHRVLLQYGQAQAMRRVRLLRMIFNKWRQQWRNIKTENIYLDKAAIVFHRYHLLLHYFTYWTTQHVIGYSLSYVM